VLITGTSSGIGLATALELARAGYNVFATMRDVARGTELREIASRERLALEILQVNVDSDESVAFFALQASQIRLTCWSTMQTWSVTGLSRNHPRTRLSPQMNTNYLARTGRSRPILKSSASPVSFTPRLHGPFVPRLPLP
jgi:NAD(P)-dependent dehydrogenase (short-subunit alcohol dehydrogenase family)